MDLQHIHHRDFVDINFDSANSWIYANWRGYQSDASVKEGCELLLDTLTCAHAAKVLNDNRQVLGIWTGVADWLAYDWFPRMRIAGMRKFALVYSPGRMSQISADTAMYLFDPDRVDVVGFFSESNATSWLALPEFRTTASREQSGTERVY